MHTSTFKPAALLLGLAVMLAACSPTPVRSGLTDAEKEGLTPAQQVFVIEADYLINKSGFADYAEQPLCIPPEVVLCHDARVVKELRGIDKRVQLAFKAARVATGDDLTARAELVRSLTREFWLALVRYGIIKVAGGV